ncbi:MAG: hypothetical protein HY852_00355 [Bradyrhizobium sp.]|uniref:hypothetical protein n=1 Tax=Bradyrhizobium sp. TaxID=376 RepID=UPI0025C58B19|nr:hypothetical protein [Bradyrhizobium sp.]MBI5260252.1 hypothetical protein [Bradyrhizobium sp.]
MPQAYSKNSTILPGAEPGFHPEKSAISSRRTVLTAALALSASAAVAPLVAADADPDAELVALAERVRRVHAAELEAYEHLSECEDRFEVIRPERPEAFDWRPTDAGLVGYVKTAEGRCICTEDDIEKLRGRRFLSWDFSGTEEERMRLGLPHPEDRTSTKPVLGFEHLFIARPDDRRQHRAAELIQALDQYQAQTDAAAEQTGLDVANEAHDALCYEQRQLCERMLDLKPKTLRGIQALATALVDGRWSGEIEEFPTANVEDRMIATIIRSLASGSLVA